MRPRQTLRAMWFGPPERTKRRSRFSSVNPARQLLISWMQDRQTGHFVVVLVLSIILSLMSPASLTMLEAKNSLRPAIDHDDGVRHGRLLLDLGQDAGGIARQRGGI